MSSSKEYRLSGKPLPDRSERAGSERVAVLELAARVPPREPAFPLLGRPVRPRLGAHGTRGPALEPVIPDGGGRAQRRVDVARFEQVPLAGRMGPDARVAVGLELEPYRAAGRAARASG